VSHKRETKKATKNKTKQYNTRKPNENRSIVDELRSVRAFAPRLLSWPVMRVTAPSWGGGGGGGKVAFVVDEMSTSIIEKQTSIIKPTNGRRTLYDTIRTALHQRGKLLLSIAMLLALCCTSEIEK
jgi:hypothetical protein